MSQADRQKRRRAPGAFRLTSGVVGALCLVMGVLFLIGRISIPVGIGATFLGLLFVVHAASGWTIPAYREEIRLPGSKRPDSEQQGRGENDP